MKDFRLYLSFLIPFFIWCIPQQLEAAFAELDYLYHDCGDGGAVGFVLNGDPNSYTYYWEHGPETLELDNLSPGVYTLVVQNFFGCVEEYEIEILSLGGCLMNYQVVYTTDPCIAVIVITVLDNNGNIIDEEALDIVWSDGSNDGLNKQVFLGQDVYLTVTITENGGDGSCCYINETISINKSPTCGERCNSELIVNEINKNQDGKGQFIELLVTGKCNCGEDTDLRGYIIDDNNGLLIPGNDFINFFTLEESIGANPGFIQFSYSQNWENIPNGSLIVIYNEQDGSIPNFPSDDPYDSNNDKVYVLQITEPGLFTAKTGTWNEDDKVLEYSGSLSNPDWEKININSPADGIQLRRPNGEFHHGISKGETPSMSTNDFPLWLSNVALSNSNIQLTGSNYLESNGFSLLEASSLLQSPGIPNSTQNQELVDTLRDCLSSPLKNAQNESGGDLTFRNEFKKQSKQFELVVAFPNPFENEVALSFNSGITGLSKLKIRSSTGKLIFYTDIPTTSGENIYHWKPNQSLSAGLLIFEFTFPSGLTQSLKVTYISY